MLPIFLTIPIKDLLRCIFQKSYLIPQFDAGFREKKKDPNYWSIIFGSRLQISVSRIAEDNYNVVRHIVQTSINTMQLSMESERFSAIILRIGDYVEEI